MISTHQCPEGKTIFECPWEEPLPPSEQGCTGCKFLTDTDQYGNKAPSCMANESNIRQLGDMGECPEGNTEPVCTYDGHCRVNEPIEPEDMAKLDE